MANTDPYEALSYTWGEESASVPVSINDNSFLIRKNLHAALLALRRRDRERALWVDAICINQGKETERNHQVWQMKGIYANASRVKVWLGDATDGSDRGMDLLQTFAQIPPTTTGQHIRSVQDFVSFYRPFLSLGDSPETFRSLEEIFELLRRPWWTRIWTLQESVLGQETDCICGTKKVPINGFSQFSAFVALAVNFGMWRGPSVDSTIQLRNAKWMGTLRRFMRKEGKISLRSAVSASWNRASSDPKDKIMGLLGLIDPQAGRAPDYRWPVEKIYQRAFFALLKETKGLYYWGIMSERPEDRNPKLPSWVPDFEIHSSAGSDSLAALSKWNVPYNASLVRNKNLDFQGTTEEDGSLLVLDGVLVDRVQTVGCKAPGWETLDDTSARGEEWRDNMKTTLQDWRSVANSAAHPYLTDESRDLAFWRTILVDLKQGAFPRPRKALGPQRLDIQNMEWLLSLESKETLDQLLATWEDACKPGFRQLRLIEQLNRRFFVTSQGHFGLGPPSLLAEDAVCILRGGPVAYALRKSARDRWRYVGECYLHGVMDGEVITKAETGENSFQTFRIE
ncbi:hypothetical protein EsH8_VII_000969 [Colletotrichum jinshuiense]